MNITKQDFDKLPYIGEGTEGIVRKFNENLVLKEMYQESFTVEKQKSINVQCGIDSMPSYIFPYDVLLIDGKYRGYAQEILKGVEPTKQDLNDLKKDILMIKNLENELYYLTFYRLLINDLWPKNSIFYNDKIYVIDTSRYSLEEDSKYLLIERENQRRLNLFFLESFILNFLDNLTIYDLNRIMKKLSPKVSELYGNVYTDINCYFDKPADFSLFLHNLMQELKCEELIDLHQKILKLK